MKGNVQTAEGRQGSLARARLVPTATTVRPQQHSVFKSTGIASYPVLSADYLSQECKAAAEGHSSAAKHS